MPRLVVFADRDRAGSWATLAHALRTLGLADARVVTLADDPALAWPHDIAEVFDGGQELGHLVRTADLLVFVDVLPDELGLFDGMLAARARDGRTRVLVQCDDAPTPLRAHAIARAVGREGWSLATTRPPCTTLAAAVLHSLDRKVCNTLNVCCVERAGAHVLLPVVVAAARSAASDRGANAVLHVDDGGRVVSGGDSRKMPMALMGRPWMVVPMVCTALTMPAASKVARLSIRA